MEMMLEGQAKEELGVRAVEITRPEFIERVVCPIASNESARTKPSPDCQASIVQDRGTGRITVRYQFDDEILVFGKLYSDELGPHSFRVLKGLWEAGLGEGALYQVTKPLAYMPEYNLLLMSAAAGTPLMSLVGEDGPEFLAHIRQAARWLVRLHRVPLRVGRAESLWESLKLFRVVRRLTKAAARVPHERKRLIEMVDALCRAGKRGPGQVPAVQTHGRFHYEHIFVNGGPVTVIDFDRSLPSDPAKDLAEFLSMLRVRAFKRTGTTATVDAATRLFLEEYLSHLPGNGVNLTVHWGAFLLLNMFHYVKKYEPDNEAFDRLMQFYAREFDAVLSGELVPGHGRGA
jgi:phosphotransferase family enzyme